MKNEVIGNEVTTSRIVLDVIDDNRQLVRKVFEGRWLVGDESNGENIDVAPNINLRTRPGYKGFSVAVTKGGRLVVVQHTDAGATDFREYEDWEDFAQAGLLHDGYLHYPDELILPDRAWRSWQSVLQ